MGYALLWEAPQRKYVLIDYLGVTAARRNGGLGAELLRLLREKFRSWDGIIVESEAPEGGQSDGHTPAAHELLPPEWLYLFAV